MVGKGGKIIQKTNFPTPRHITIIEDPVKFQEMFDQAMHHALINQSGVMTSFVKNAVYQMMCGRWEPGYTGSCYSNPETLVAAASRAVASATASIGPSRFHPLQHWRV